MMEIGKKVVDEIDNVQMKRHDKNLFNVLGKNYNHNRA